MFLRKAHETFDLLELFEDEEPRGKLGRSKSGGSGGGGKGTFGFLYRNGFKGSGVFGGKSKRPRIGWSPNFLDRRTTIKGRYVRNGGKQAGSIKRHIRYLGREEAGENGASLGFFNGERLSSDEVKEFVKRCEGDRHTWRFIVSPEDGLDLDLEEYAAIFIMRMEKELGTNLEWVGVEHRNTQNPHVHLLVRGKRDNGRDLVIKKEFIGFGMRKIASELSTELLGKKTLSSAITALRKEIKEERFTAVDRELWKQQKKFQSDRINISLIRSVGGFYGDEAQRFVRDRVKVLHALGVVNVINASEITLKYGWDKVLRELGLRGDRIKTMHRVLYGRNKLESGILELKENESFTGKVIHKDLEDELKESSYLLVESADGTVKYVPASFGNKEAKVGDTVTLVGKEKSSSKKGRER